MSKKGVSVALLSILIISFILSISGCDKTGESTTASAPSFIEVYSGPESSRVHIADVSIADDGAFRLKVIAEHESVSRLKELLSDIEERGTLPLVFEEMDGENIITKRQEIGPSNSYYIFAVSDNLSSEFFTDVR